MTNFAHLRRWTVRGRQGLMVSLRAVIMFGILLPSWAIPTLIPTSAAAETESSPDSAPTPFEENLALNAEASTESHRRSQGLLSLLPAQGERRLSASSRGTPASPRGHLLPNGLCAPQRC